MIRGCFDQFDMKVKGMRCEIDGLHQKLDNVLAILKSEAVAIAMSLDLNEISKIQDALSTHVCSFPSSSAHSQSCLKSVAQPESELSPVKCELFNLFEDEIDMPTPQRRAIKDLQACTSPRFVGKAHRNRNVVQTVESEDPVFIADPWRMASHVPEGQAKSQRHDVESPASQFGPQQLHVDSPAGQSVPQQLHVDSPVGQSGPQQFYVDSPVSHSGPQRRIVDSSRGQLSSPSPATLQDIEKLFCESGQKLLSDLSDGFLLHELGKRLQTDG